MYIKYIAQLIIIRATEHLFHIYFSGQTIFIFPNSLYLVSIS